MGEIGDYDGARAKVEGRDADRRKRLSLKRNRQCGHTKRVHMLRRTPLNLALGERHDALSEKVI